MTLPNKLTLLRLLLIPVMVVIYYVSLNVSAMREFIFSKITIANFIIAMIFIVASLTDLLDGYLARKYNQVTTFGKFADPLADKVLVFTALLILMDQNVVPMWVVAVIMAREFIVSGIRLVAVEQGQVIAAGMLGKIKTAVTMVALVVLFFVDINKPIEITGLVLLYISTALTVISGIEYFWKNRKSILKSV